MAKYEKVGKGAAFTREKTNENQPDFGGSVTMNADIHKDEEIQIAMWKSRTKKGDPYLSVQFSRKLEDDSDLSGPWDKDKKEQPERKGAQ